MATSRYLLLNLALLILQLMPAFSDGVLTLPELVEVATPVFVYVLTSMQESNKERGQL